MTRTRKSKALVITIALPLLYLAGVSPDAPASLILVREARAVVGAPLTPVSAAGVARRTTRRVVVAESSATQASAATTATAQQQAATAQQQSATAQQQSASKPETRSGVEYQNCGGVLYRAAFQGNNLVYVVQ
ncbi:MAG: hypothetical protein MUE63_13970 [Xanthomonadales bacterium]|nr:hypothetical protein [Xanthomonadales bacterium]